MADSALPMHQGIHYKIATATQIYYFNANTLFKGQCLENLVLTETVGV